MTLQTYFADLHIHIGRDMDGRPVKISGSKSLTLTNILREASRRKGLGMIGVIDSQVPAVQKEFQRLIAQKQATPLQEGGIQFEKVTCLLGAEIEVYDDTCQGPIHVLCYFPTLEQIGKFSEWLEPRMKNIALSSQRYYGSALDLQKVVKSLEGLFIPAHVFTPFKSLYGKGVHRSLTEVFDPEQIDAIELGLSSDSMMADQIEELHRYTYVSNSDAHSLAKIGREYQAIQMKAPSFKEFAWALYHINGRKIIRNYGMNPQLGKYHATVCQKCLHPATIEIKTCPNCQSMAIVKGVSDRIQELATTTKGPSSRPPYLHQVPLDYLPTLGPKTYEKLIDHFQTEMNIIHHATFSELKSIVSENLATMIIDLRNGRLDFEPGGGGTYGRIKTTKGTTK